MLLMVMINNDDDVVGRRQFILCNIGDVIRKDKQLNKQNCDRNISKSHP